MRRPPPLLVALAVLAAIVLVAGRGEAELVGVALIAAMASLLHRTRPAPLEPDVR